MKSKLPERSRWEGWVVFTWLIAALTAVASLFLVGAHGQVEVPRPSGFGTTTEVNIFIWAIGIGQTVGALLLAALFSMINSVYQNSCELVAASRKGEEGGDEAGASLDPENVDLDSGLLVKTIRTASQLEGILRPGYKLLSVNGHQPEDELDAAQLVVDGENDIQFMTTGGEVIRRSVPMRRGPLHIKFQDPE